ncbi:conserved hypothetical protein [Gloeothece citriformis PCC 7424]|uniref:Uncharacterized protein n=1 Tax=Gloeothece citriformis (strain PCC 7424) TaxID=65393 RepID=B7KJW9_GLOC7|nr:hypothetical protein [Gloeothece citriformis]ACK69568.1 conserved hypothetical protein [Gloeothece citriformis PCC 7424]
MTNVKDHFIGEDLGVRKNNIPWWKREVWGKDSLLEDLISKFRKPSVPESIYLLHIRSMMDLQVFAKSAKALDNDKFSNEEFLLYVKIKCALRKGLNEYEKIAETVELFQVAIEAKNSYITLDQTELRYRSSKQQQLYDFVQELLIANEDKTQFRSQVKEKLNELLPQIKTEEGRNALQAYVKELDKLAEHELGLKLLSLFKVSNLADYSILRIISDLINSLKEQDVTNLKTLTVLVINQYDVFEQLGRIIGITGTDSTPETYGRMIQYITLSHRHKLSYIKFEELMKVMRQWYPHYLTVSQFREQYPPKKYTVPKDFFQPIPGIEIYEKYQKSLTDKNTGLTYINFN